MELEDYETFTELKMKKQKPNWKLLANFDHLSNQNLQKTQISQNIWYQE